MKNYRTGLFVLAIASALSAATAYLSEETYIETYNYEDAAPPTTLQDLKTNCEGAGGTVITGGKLGKNFGCLCPNTGSNPAATPTIIVFPIDLTNQSTVQGYYEALQGSCFPGPGFNKVAPKIIDPNPA